MSGPIDCLGTDEAVPERLTFRVGPLSAVLEAGALRDVTWHGALVLRAASWLLRDDAWGTPPLTVSDVRIVEDDGSVSLTWTLGYDGPAGAFLAQARVRGEATGVRGRLRFEVQARPSRDVRTNRLGFVVLHPDSLAGSPLRIGHGDGTEEGAAFPERVMADQPAFDIRSLAYGCAPGVDARIAFDGGIWEMEDQRNWSDASFKTYVRPLSLPRPYVVPAGAIDRQVILLDLAGQPEPVAAALPPVSGDLGRVPPLWLRLADGAPIPSALPLPDLAGGLILRVAADAPDRDRLAAARALAAREGLAFAVEALFPQIEPTGEAQALLAAIGPVDLLLACARRDRHTRPSHTLPPGEAPLESTLRALRAAGYQGPLGAGTPAFFTEFNRNPPPPSDLAFFGSSPLVHAADDRSVMETPAVLAAILDSAAALLPGTPLCPGPLGLAPAVNPYGPGLARSDGRSRLCMAERDPRHGALFGAAHLVATLAVAIPRSAAVAPAFASGPSGVVDAAGRPLPLAFVHAGVAGARGCRLWLARVEDGMAVVGWHGDAGERIALVANLTPEPKPLPPPLLDAPETARLQPGDRGWADVAQGTRLGAYDVVRLRLGGPTT